MRDSPVLLTVADLRPASEKRKRNELFGARLKREGVWKKPECIEDIPS